MSKEDGRILAEMVHSWVNGTNGEDVKREVRKWTRTKATSPNKATAKNNC